MKISDEKIAEIKAAADIVAVISESVTLKKNGNNHFGLCPFHSEKSPSFSVSAEKQMFYCFGCGAGGDVIKYLVKKEGVSFYDAAIHLAEKCGIDVEVGQRASQNKKFSSSTHQKKPERPGFVPDKAATPVHQKKPERPGFVPDKAATPVELWQQKAAALVSWAHERLLENPAKLAWLEKRGINIDTVREFTLGWNPGENDKDIFRPRKSWGLEPAFREDGKEKKLWIPVGLVIPLIRGQGSGFGGQGSGVRGQVNPETRNQEPETEVLRIRIRRDSGDPKYYVLPGSGMGCMVLSEKHCRAYVIVESELDGLLVFQEVRQNGIGVIALGSAQKKPDMETYGKINAVPVILNALDYDSPGAKAVSWWKDNVKAFIRWPVPYGKDPGDAFENYGVDIGEWIRLGLPEAWSWKSRGRSRDQGSVSGAQGTNGQSSSCLLKREGASPESSLSDKSPLMEFVRLIKSSPVAVHVGQDGLEIKEPPSWSAKYPDVSRRISELVFLNSEVREFLIGLGTDIVTKQSINIKLGA